MIALSTRERYGTMAQLLHWATAVLVVAAFVYGPGGSEQRVYSAAKDFDRQIHETLGICVLAIALLRIGWRTFDSSPARPPMPAWMAIASTVGHGVLYVMLALVPLTAIAGAWLEGHPLTFVGGVRVTPLFVEHHSLGSTVAELHTWLGDALLWVAGAHAVAALYHHFVLRDRVLRSMLPGAH